MEIFLRRRFSYLWVARQLHNKKRAFALFLYGGLAVAAASKQQNDDDDPDPVIIKQAAQAVTVHSVILR